MIYLMVFLFYVAILDMSFKYWVISKKVVAIEKNLEINTDTNCLKLMYYGLIIYMAVAEFVYIYNEFTLFD